MVQVSKKNTGWWEDFFPAFRPAFAAFPRKFNNAEARYLMDKLKLKPGRKFLDCPCGIGRTAILMAKAGVRVTGVDITQSYLEELAAACRKRKISIKLVNKDMRRIDYDSEFDASGNIWTSFGYFRKESDNLLVLKKMFKALKPGGMFVLVVLNRDWIMKNFLRTGWRTAGDIKILENRKFDYARSVSITEWTYIKDGRETTLESAIRLYSYHEICRMFESAGFENIEGYGSFKDDRITADTNMMYIFGGKSRG